MQPSRPNPTLATAFHEAVSRLHSAGYDTTEARATARLLLDSIAGQPHAHLLHAERLLTDEESRRFEAALSRLERGEPLPHVLCVAHFHGLQLKSDARALIPRPETELLVDEALRRLQDVSSPRIADLGTGSGAIAIAVAVARPDAEVWASDISEDARDLTVENAKTLGVSDRVNVVPGLAAHWDAFLDDEGFDAVLSNPPYIPSSDIGDLQTQVRDYEPRLALDGGPDGLNAYRLLAVQVPWLLVEGGFFACELGAEQFAAVREHFEAQNWTVEPPVRDFAGIERVLVAHGRWHGNARIESPLTL